MEKVDIKKLFYKKQCQMLASFNLTSTLTHPVSKGDATEDEWRNWFNDYFPKRYRAEKAFVIDCEGNRSEQMDVVIYDTHFSPTIFQINDEKFIPAESVYAVFEVKQDLTKDHIEYAAKKIESVKSLKRTSAPINTINGFVLGRPAPQIIGGLLTLNSGWKTENIEDNLKKSLSEKVGNRKQEIDFICCLSCFSCALEYNADISEFHGRKIYLLKDITIITDTENAPLIFTYFKLLRMLQDLGNVPAIEYSKYGINGIDPKVPFSGFKK